ncbi:MAG: exonuclease VII large subunit [Pirellulaceae bacterium]|jgi:exonuclease VII large subunit
MSKSAKVSSIEALPQFKTALTRYEEGMRDGLTMLMLEVRRGLNWLENDRAPYWRREYRKASDRLTEARQVLERKELTINADDRPSCYEEKKQLEKAKRRLQYCEEKMDAVKKWVQITRQESEKFETQIARLTNFLDNDLSRATASLERMVGALDKYTQSTLSTSGSDSSPPPKRASETATDTQPLGPKSTETNAEPTAEEQG